MSFLCLLFLNLSLVRCFGTDDANMWELIGIPKVMGLCIRFDR